jgi:acyl carrier protein
MSPDEVRRHILEALHRIAPEADLDRIDPEENLREALDIDSFDFLRVIVSLHETFGVAIPESDYPRLTTLKAMTAYLAGLQ